MIEPGFSAIEDIVADIAAGKMVVVVDDEDREAEGDLVCAADAVSDHHINFMATHARGLICLAMTGDDCRRLQLPPMTPANQAALGTAFTVSVDATQGITTGISAADRAHTVAVCVDPKCQAHDLVRPGHIFPLEAKDGGVLVRAGHTEAAVDLARLAGRPAAGVICEIMNDDGTMARRKDLLAYSQKHQLKMCSIAQLIDYRKQQDAVIERRITTRMPTEFGEFALHLYRSFYDGKEHMALTAGGITPHDLKADNECSEPVLVRAHSECCTGEVFCSTRCDCQAQLYKAMEMIQEHGRGVLLYLRQEGRGIGLEAKLKAYALQDQGLDTVEANVELGYRDDERDYGVGAHILRHLGVQQIRLMTNNPRKFKSIHGHGLEIVERVPLVVQAHEGNAYYLKTKAERLEHVFGQASFKGEA